MDFLKNLGKVFSDPKKMVAIGSIAEGAGSILGSLSQHKLGKKMLAQNQKQYDHMMRHYNREKSRQENAEKQLYLGFQRGLVDLEEEEERHGMATKTRK